MRILFESYPYTKTSDVLETTIGLYPTSLNKDKLSIERVGYYFNPKLNNGKGDVIFILPKVFLDKDEKNTVFGIEPPDLLKTDLKEWAKYESEDAECVSHKFIADFIFGFSVWIYRALKVYEKRIGHKRQDSLTDDNGDIIEVSSLSIGKDDKKFNNTLFDILLAIQEFNKENQAFITFTIKNLHSGYNKINWNKTISHSTAFIQDETPVYLSPVNKKRVINFDEELLIIFFSILNYMNTQYCFKERIPFGYDLITGKKFENYLKGQGRTRLLRIKYKYFSDKAIRMWQLCYAFFEKQRAIGMGDGKDEYILVNKFNTVFEDMIDALIGDDNLPEGLKTQGDDKRIDHLYTYNDLLEQQDKNRIYYIGDSKYYPMGKGAVGHDAPKQFTYARNVIQWHLDLLNGVKPDVKNYDVWKRDTQKYMELPLFDEITEGYNIIPNFFISGIVNKDRLLQSQKNYYDETDGGLKPADRKDQNPHQWQFFDKLFDRSTLFLSHYDVNFLFILKKYARLSKSGEVQGFKKKAHDLFRKHVIDLLEKYFTLYKVDLPFDDDDELMDFVHENYYEIHGRIFSFEAEGGKVLLYAEPIVEAIQNLVEDESYSKYLRFKSLISPNGDMLCLKSANVTVKKVHFGEDIKKEKGKIEYKHKDISNQLQSIQDDNPDVDIMKSVEIISSDHIIELKKHTDDSRTNNLDGVYRLKIAEEIDDKE